MYGITDTGFLRKPLQTILEEIRSASRGVFGDDLDVSVQSPDGQIMQNSALSSDQLWQIAEYSYNATDPDKTTGAALSSLVKLNGIERQESRATRMTLILVGIPNSTIGTAQTVSNGSGLFATTLSAFTFDGVGNATVEAQLTVVGPVTVLANTIDTIETPQTGWTSVNNPAAGILGRDREEDPELRVRRSNSTAAASSNLIESLIGAVGDVEGVSTLTVLENDTGSIDSNGIPPHSFEVIVAGGDNQDIVDAIWANKPFGIGTSGNNNGVAFDSQGIPHTILFTRPVSVPIYVTLTLDKRPDYPGDGDALIKQAFVDYSEGSLVEGRGFGPDDDVIYTELYVPANVVEGMDIDDMRSGTSPSPTGVSNIVINLREDSFFDINNIIII